MSIVKYLALLLIFSSVWSCGGGTSDSVDSTGGSGDSVLRLSKSLVSPGEIIELSHPDIDAGETITVVLASMLDDSRMEITFDAVKDGAVLFAFPPLQATDDDTNRSIRVSLHEFDGDIVSEVSDLPDTLDPSTPPSEDGSEVVEEIEIIRISGETDAQQGVGAGLEEGVDFAVVEVRALPDIDASIPPGFVVKELLNTSIENIEESLNAFKAVKQAEGASTALDEAISELEFVKTYLHQIDHQLSLSGTLSVATAEGEEPLSLDELRLVDRWYASQISAMHDAIQPDVDFTRGVSTRVLTLTTNVRPSATISACTHPGCEPLSASELKALELRSQIARLQLAEGRNLRSDEISNAMLGVALSAMGVSDSLGGAAATAGGIGHALASESLVPYLLASQLAKNLSQAMLNGEPARSLEGGLSSASKFGIALGAVSLVAFTTSVAAPVAIGAVAVKASVALSTIKLLGGMASLAGLSLGIGQLIVTAEHAYDMQIHIPPGGLPFSEFRAAPLGSFSKPRIKVFVSDEPSVTNGFNLRFSGIDSNSDWREDLWAAYGITHRSDALIHYGLSAYGETNSARAYEPFDYEGVPATALDDYAFFTIEAQGILDKDWGTPGSAADTGRVDIKYADGPVVFTYVLSSGQVLPADDSANPDPFTIEATLYNGSSMPLSIYGLEFELALGFSAEPALYNDTHPLITVDAGENKTFRLENIVIDVPEAYRNVALSPRLLINNKRVEPLQQRFWHHLRSVPMLAGPVTVKEVLDPNDPVTHPTEAVCPKRISNEGVGGDLLNTQFVKRTQDYSAACFYVAEHNSEMKAVLAVRYSPYDSSLIMGGEQGQCGYFDVPHSDSPFAVQYEVVVDNEVVEHSDDYFSTLRTITTQYSGHKDFVIDQRGVLLDLLNVAVAANVGVSCAQLEAL